MPELNVGINARGATKGAKKVVKALDTISRKAGGLASKAFRPLNLAIAGIGSAASIVGLAKISDSYTVMASQLEYATGSTSDAVDVQKKLYEVSKQTGTSMKENANSFVKLSQAAKLTGLSMDENLQVIGTLNALMIKTGTTGAQASAAMLQLSQALTSGKLAGDEFRSMAENAPGVLNALSEAMDIPRENLKAMATAGELTSEKLGAAFLQIAESGNVAFEELPKTAAKGWNAIVLAFQTAWAAIGDESGVMLWLHDSLMSLANWIETNSYIFGQWFMDMKDNIVDAWPEIQIILQNLLTNMGTLWQDIKTNMPTMETFFSGLTTLINGTVQVLSIFIKSFSWILQNWAKIVKWADFLSLGIVSGTARMVGTLSGGGSGAEAWKAYGEGGPFSNQQQSQSQGNTINNNFNYQMSREDVAALNAAQARQASRL